MSLRDSSLRDGFSREIPHNLRGTHRLQHGKLEASWISHGVCEGRDHKAVGKNMLTLIKLTAAIAIALGVLSPNLTPGADSCECKAKAEAQQLLPRADTCECKAKATSGGAAFIP
jgi:hypothetical protein